MELVGLLCRRKLPRSRLDGGGNHRRQGAELNKPLQPAKGWKWIQSLRLGEARLATGGYSRGLIYSSSNDNQAMNAVDGRGGDWREMKWQHSKIALGSMQRWNTFTLYSEFTSLQANQRQFCQDKNRLICVLRMKCVFTIN